MNPVNTKPYELPSDAVWMITGCSSGIGKELATLIASKPSHRLIATARKPEALSYLPDSANVLKLELDVTSTPSVDAAFAEAAKHFGGRLDVVVNNAGYSLQGDTENATDEQTHREMETLFFGTARVAIRAVSVMRQQEPKGGLIFNISSAAGLAGFPGTAYYHAAKFAVEGWTESVAREMHSDWNINFCLIEPGGTKTNFETTSKEVIAPHPAYADPEMPARKIEKFVQMGVKAGAGMEPAAVVETIYNIASAGDKIPLHVPLSLVCWTIAKAKFEGWVKELDAIKEISCMGQKELGYKLPGAS